MLVPTEIGQPYSMHLSNKNKTTNELSILIHKDGFSFCTHDQHHLFSLEKASLNAESLISWMKYHQISDHAKKIIHLDQPAITVPLALFDEEQPLQYLKSAIDPEKELVPKYNLLPTVDQAVVYGVTPQWDTLFDKTFPEIEQIHLVGELLPALSKYSFGKAKRNLFVHLRKGAFDLFLYQGGQLLLQNCFPQNNMDDFLYYLFYVTEQFYLKPAQFNLHFLGKFTQYEDYYNGVKDFHDSIDFFEPHYSLIDHQHPVPFFQTFNAE